MNRVMQEINLREMELDLEKRKNYSDWVSGKISKDEYLEIDMRLQEGMDNLMDEREAELSFVRETFHG